LLYRPERRVRRRVADQDVDPAPLRQRRIDERLQFRLAADVARHRNRLLAARSELGAHALAYDGLAAGDDDLRAGVRHLFRDGLADALGRAGDESDLACEAE